MKLLIACQVYLFVSAVHTATVFRLDRSSPFDLQKIGHSLKATTRNNTLASKAVLDYKDAFIVNLECESGIPAIICANVKDTIKSAANRVARNLMIVNPIIISVKYRDFCKGQELSACPLSNVLGSARYASAFVIKKDGAYYTSNQAVIKQTKTNVVPPFSNVDICNLLIHS